MLEWKVYDSNVIHVPFGLCAVPCGMAYTQTPLSHINGVLCRMKLINAVEQFMEWRKRNGFAAPTNIQNASNLRQFAIFMHNCDLEAVREQDVLQYIAMLNDEFHLQPNGMIPKCNVLRQFFKYWNERDCGQFDYRAIPLPRKEFTMPRLCTKADFAKFWNAVAEYSTKPQRVRNVALVSLIASTGIRNGEACALRVDSLDCTAPVKIPTGGRKEVTMFRGVVKTEKSRGMRPFREIFWNETVNAHLSHWLERREELHKQRPFANPDFLFVGLNSPWANRGGWGAKMVPGSVDEIFTRYSRIAGVDINPHMLRHLLGRDMAEADASEHVISDVLGHSRLDSSRIYTRLYGKAVGRQFNRFRGLHWKG